MATKNTNNPTSDDDGDKVKVITKNTAPLMPKSEKSKNPCVNLVRNYPVIFVTLMAILIIAIVLAIVLPLTLVKPKAERPIKARCPDGKLNFRVECLPDKVNLLAAGTNLETACRQRGCCWSSAPEGGGPNCAFHTNYGFRQTKVKETTSTGLWFELTRMEAPPAMTRSDIPNIEFKIEMHTDYRLRIKIFPRRNYKNKQQRWEVPSGVIGENIHRRKYRVEYSDAPFSFRIIRNSSNTVLFDTTDTSLIFSDQFVQVSTRLPSPYVFGIGEVNKDGFMNDMNFKSIPLMASMNHPNIAREKINLYSQFPSYLVIEPDGKSHVVVFYNSNPSEFFLTPFPSLSYRTIGGILDIYIFMGPTPIQAIEQYQQAFGLPKLPPYWSMGLQIGAKKFQTSQRLNTFLNRFRLSRLGFDSVLVGVEHMYNATMFTLDDSFNTLNTIVDRLRTESRATMLQMLPAMGNNTQNYPFSEGVSRERYWIMENFFSSGVVGKILGRNVVYPDFTMEKTRIWWHDALSRFFFTDATVKFDGIFFDYLTPLDETLNKTCPNNKWNNPPYKYDFIPQPISNGTICMDSRYEITKHYNMHGVYSHFAIESTAKILEVLIHNRSLIMSRHGFLGTGQFAAKWLGEYDARWEDFRRSIINMVDLSMFGFQQAGSDMCGYSGGSEADMDLCENWIKASGMSPFMKLIVESGGDDDPRFRQLLSNGLFEVLNSSICLRYQLLPYLYTQYYKAAVHGTPVVRPLAYEFPTDIRSFQINNQWMWGNKLMVSVGTSQGSISSAYVPREDWYDYYRGYLIEGRGDMVGVQPRRNETSLLVRAGSVIFKQDCMHTAVHSAQTFIDIIVALNRTDNFTAYGELFIDDSTRKNSQIKDNYHRLIEFKVYRKDDDGIIEVKKLSGRYLTKLAFRDLIIMGLRSKPMRITVNENSLAIDQSKCVWDEQYSVYYVNLQTEVKRKVLLDNEYLSFRWSGGFEYSRNGNQMFQQPPGINNPPGGINFYNGNGGGYNGNGYNGNGYNGNGGGIMI